ncbi:MAG: hypothetical protein CSYNP_04447 [Syntrophus sp. SKADARSKE-3]|nr:hypothetical protein [Syntrophus sp. SKADARSKE-3]
MPGKKIDEVFDRMQALSRQHFGDLRTNTLDVLNRRLEVSECGRRRLPRHLDRRCRAGNFLGIAFS